LGEKFGEPAHGPDVGLIAERGEEAFEESLVPSDLAGAGGEFLAFALEPDHGGLAEEQAEVGVRPVAERGLALAAERFGQDGIRTEPMPEFFERGIELTVEDESGDRVRPGGAGFPDDVELDPAIGGIDVVAVAVPGGGVQIDLDIAGPGKIIAELDQGIAEVGAGFMVPETGVKNPEGTTVQGDELIPAEALVLPERLEKALGGNAVGRFLEQEHAQGMGAPLGITI
jgi:hypothetical protein